MKLLANKVHIQGMEVNDWSYYLTKCMQEPQNMAIYVSHMQPSLYISSSKIMCHLPCHYQCRDGCMCETY